MLDPVPFVRGIALAIGLQIAAPQLTVTDGAWLLAVAVIILGSLIADLIEEFRT